MKIWEKLAARTAVTLLKSLHASSTWKLNGASIEQLEDWLKTPSIIVFWHSQQLSFAVFTQNLHRAAGRVKPASLGRFAMLVSRHRDGQLIGRTIGHLGIKTIAGSSTRGGVRAVLQLKNCISHGYHVGITPDGPKGPKEVAKAGAARLAQITGAPILACAIQTSSAWTFSSWDRMFLTKPWSQIDITVGRPVWISSDLPLEEALATLQSELDKVNNWQKLNQDNIQLQNSDQEDFT